MDRRRRLERWALVGLFVLAFVPRALCPVSRPLQWYFRAAGFFEAVLHADWAGTLFSEHPGVTVMWLSGAALWGWYGLQTFLGLGPPAPLETEGYAFADRVTVAVLPLALLVALGIVWGWYLLRRLFDRRVAWLGALLWALDPFLLANSKAIHLDALLSTLMLLSALWMLVYLRERGRKHLLLSALLGGMAILTKVTALFLFPFLGLCLLVDWLPSVRRPRAALGGLARVARDLLLWLLVAALCFLCWPSVWVQPARTLGTLVERGIVSHVDQAHSLPRFHRGEVAMGDPGVAYYLDAVLYRTTFITLPFAVVGLLAGVRAALAGRRERARLLLLLGAFAVFYFIQMALGGRKESRYVLPILLALDVLAAAGMVWWGEGLLAVPRLRPLLRAIPLALAVQAQLVLPRSPYFGTCYNGLLGGPAAAVRVLPAAEFGEGLDLAGRYVDGQSGAEEAVVGTQFLANEMLAQYVRAPVHDVALVGDDVDYLVFGIQYTTRGPEHARWGALWEETYRFREPELVVSFDGIPYAWVHRPDAEPVIPGRVDARLGEEIRLEGYRLAADAVAPGDVLLLSLYWRAEDAVEGDYTVFVHLQGPDGRLAAQQDNPPVRGARPTSAWEAGVLVEDPYEIRVPDNAAAGDYLLSAGMYDPTTMERLPAAGAGGEREIEDRVLLARVGVAPAVAWWQRVVPAAWLGLVVLGATGSRFARGETESSKAGSEEIA